MVKKNIQDGWFGPQMKKSECKIMAKDSIFGRYTKYSKYPKPMKDVKPPKKLDPLLEPEKAKALLPPNDTDS